MGKKICFIIIFLIGTLSGCANYKELNEIALVVGMGIDYLPSKRTFEVTFQVVNPTENAAHGTGSGATPIINYKTSGKTLSEALRRHANIFSRQNIYSHIQLVVLSERLAKKESLNFIFDLFEREAAIRVNVPVLITRDADVKKTMDILATMDKIPVRTLVGKLKNASNLLGEYGETKIYDLIEDLTNDGSEPFISGISIKGDPKTGASKSNEETMDKTYTKLNGIAIFRNGKLVGWLDGKKTKALQIIDNKLKQTNLRIPCDGKRDASVMVNSLKSHSKVDITDDHVVIKVQVNAYGYMSEMLCNKDLSKPEVTKKFEHKAQQELEKEIKEGIVAVQKMKSDVFGFGEMLRYTNKSKWKKAKHNWSELFSQANVEVHVNMVIEETGMRIKVYPF